MSQKEVDPRTALVLCLLCPCIVISLIYVFLFFLAPESGGLLSPKLPQYRVRIDFNELNRIKEKNSDAQHRTADNYVTSPEVIRPAEPPASNMRLSADTEEKNTPTATAPPQQPFSPPALAYNSMPPLLPELNLPPTFLPPELPPKKGKPIRFVKTTLQGIPMYQAIIDLTDPQMFINVELANQATQANSSEQSHGDEPFPSFVKRSHGALVQNGTFFSKDDQKRVMGNMVAGGRYLKYSQWENYGTTFGLKKNNQPEMITARLDGQPDWSQQWFSITCGPRLVRAGAVQVDAESEGFQDSHVLGVGPRCALGYSADKTKLYMVTFLKGLSLTKEAEVMKAMGCQEAMNLDGGASKALAHDGNIVVPAKRALTNCIVVYDTNFPAPRDLITSWREFQKRPDQMISYEKECRNGSVRKVY